MGSLPTDEACRGVRFPEGAYGCWPCSEWCRAELHPECAVADSCGLGAGRPNSVLNSHHGPRVEHDVAGLEADLERRVVRPHSAQYARDLLRRIPIARQSCAVAPQLAILGLTRSASCRSCENTGALLRKWCAIATGQWWTAAPPGIRLRVGQDGYYNDDVL